MSPPVWSDPISGSRPPPLGCRGHGKREQASADIKDEACVGMPRRVLSRSRRVNLHVSKGLAPPPTLGGSGVTGIPTSATQTGPSRK